MDILFIVNYDENLMSRSEKHFFFFLFFIEYNDKIVKNLGLIYN